MTERELGLAANIAQRERDERVAVVGLVAFPLPGEDDALRPSDLPESADDRDDPSVGQVA